MDAFVWMGIRPLCTASKSQVIMGSSGPAQYLDYWAISRVDFDTATRIGYSAQRLTSHSYKFNYKFQVCGLFLFFLFIQYLFVSNLYLIYLCFFFLAPLTCLSRESRPILSHPQIPYLIGLFPSIVLHPLETQYVTQKKVESKPKLERPK